MSIIGDYCTEAITITKKGALGADGVRSYTGTATTTTARVADRAYNKLLPHGIVGINARVFYVRPSEDIALGDRITYGANVHDIVELYKPKDLNGTIQYIMAEVRLP